jgi:putative oxidoreductase
MRRTRLFPTGQDADAAALLLRLVIGPVMAYHGAKKLGSGFGRFEQVVQGLPVPAPGLVARAVVVIELVGGLCLLAGLLTRVWALFLAGEMVSIVFLVKWDNGLAGAPGKTGFELDLVIATCAATLFLIGPGALALDHLVQRGRDRPRQRQRQTRTGSAARV